MDVLQTRLRAPPLRREYVERPRLLDLLEHGHEAKITLISAPAGFGKSTLLSAWLRRPERRVAWVSLDPDDNAWPRFLTCLLTGLQSLDSGFGAGLLGALTSAQPPSFDHFLSALPRALAEIPPLFVLVLDDLHVLVDAQAHELLTYLIDNQPAGMRTVLSGRSDPPWPLARLRASGALQEIRAADLLFTLDEAGALLNGALGLDLSEQDLARLQERTEGWVTGLHLAALSLRNAADRQAFLRDFAGSDRFVLDYLLEEVFAQQSDEVRRFLLETSILDRFNADLCDCVTGRKDSQVLLQRLEVGNLFVTSLDSERMWFAYHSLMRSFLVSVLKQREPDRVVSLHARASEWYAAHGDIIDAIQHGLAAEDHERLARLIRTNGLALVFQGDLSTVLAWLHGSAEAWRRTGPWLRIAQLWGHSFSGNEPSVVEELAQSRALVEEDLAALEEDSPKAVELRHALAHLTAIEANLAQIDGRHVEAAMLARRAVSTIPPGDPTALRYSYVVLGMALRHQGALREAAEALDHADAPGSDLETTPAPARGLATLAAIQIWMGQLDEAEATCRRLITLHDEYLHRCGRRLPIAAFGYARLSDIALQRNHLEEALRYAQESRVLAEQWQQIDALFESLTHLARAERALGDLPSALALLRRLEHLVRDRSPWLWSVTRMEEARLCLAVPHDRLCLDRARAWALENPLPLGGRLVFRDHALYLTQALMMLHEGQADRSRAAEGLNLAVRLVQLLEPTGALGLVLQASLVAAQLEAILGEQSHALARLLGCLEIAEARGYVRPFVDNAPGVEPLLDRVPPSYPCFAYAQHLRQSIRTAQFPRVAFPVLSPGPAVPTLEEPLSERELEVLRLLASTLSSGEIADELCVATSTVRSHTKAIYGKLGVHTRLEAIDTARDLGLI